MATKRGIQGGNIRRWQLREEFKGEIFVDGN